MENELIELAGFDAHDNYVLINGHCETVHTRYPSYKNNKYELW